MSEYNEKISEATGLLPQCGVRYEAVDLSAVDYAPAAPFRALYVGGPGDITITGLDGISATFFSVPAGIILPLSGTGIVRATTTATLLRAIR
jgi:hypothetical protein